MKMLGRVAAAAALLCVVLSLSGCSPATSLYLINHTGRTIEVLHSAGRWRDEKGVVHVERWRRWWAWPFLIDQGVGRRIDYMRGRDWIVDVRMASCRVHYEAAMDPAFSVDLNPSWRAFERMHWAVTTQLEPDGRLYLVAVPDAKDNRPRAVDIASFVAIQPEGFPVEPSSRVCRAK